MNTITDIPRSFGPFEVLEAIGQGGSATVYKVRHKSTEMIAALKVGPSYLMLQPGAVERFRREFTVIRPLEHPNVVRALAQGEQDGVPYIVLEYVPGENLDDRLKQRGPLTLEETVAIFVQVTEGLRYLHANHILHRDIKPSNIFLTPNQQAKLGDFGLLKSLKDDIELTGPRQAMGTIEYGAPEQFEDAKNVDQRCDLYSLGATLYTALSGKFPFGNGGQLQVLQRKVFNQFVPLGLLLPSLDPAIDRLVNRCLDSQPNQRPSDCDEFLTVLRTRDTRLAVDTGSATELDFPKVELASGPERRASLRFAIDLTANLVPFHQRMRGHWQATILDVSVSGIRLQMNRSIAVNSVLQVTVGNRATSELALVRWVTPGEGQTYYAGCSFVRPLASQDLETICRAGARKTVHE
jgi:serine/threonine protein kinase